MNYEEKLQALLAMDFIHLDFDAAIPVFGDFIRKRREEQGWSQIQVGKLVGKDRSHICKAELNPDNMGFSQMFMYCMLWDADMNELKNDMWQAVLNAPLIKPREKKK